MQFLAFLETVAANLNAGNISEFITLTENMISLGESIFQHQSTSASAPSATSPNTTIAS